MAQPDALIGLVTHARSRFNADGAAARRLEELAAGLRDHGLAVATIVSDRDDYDEDRWPISRREVLRTAIAQARLERRWRAHVAGRARPGDALLAVAMGARRSLGAVRAPGGSPGGRAIRRLLNIDLSHRRVWQAAIEQGAGAVLVLEDDALAEPGAVAAVTGILRALRALPGDARVLVNCSASIDPTELGVAGLLAHATPVDADLPAGTALVELPRAATNTVCAVAYTPALASALVRHLDTGLLPAQPIDWRVNEVILADPGIRAWWLLPAPFTQGSMAPRP